LLISDFLCIILDNLIDLMYNKNFIYKKWLRSAVRIGKNEILDIPEEIIEVID